ncbi:hypothetical protein F2P56_026920 [Juglans regia]|uniref:Uncharacterized protein LOC108988747 isoform X2 n=2 Tax=Juglans regia TaxID=51240 RepID=A0A2I4EE06_JUGRE|nr:uncharacterized protein LOC108988747 isoform X2 [Juglans regia]KAF5451858.1 hypothetical protein F2P56_026920 [Juglans regia]
MEMELEPRVKPLPYKVKATSRESPSQKATHVLDSDLRTHWSSGTNTKEWILLELDEPCLLSHVRIYNKSVLEWEIAVGLRYKPETFVKVRPRCEAPRRDMVYPMNYTPCRYVRISCLRGNPIAIFFIQLIGVSVTGLDPEFQPVVNYLLPQIISHKQDAHDMHLQLLKDLTDRLLVFLPQLEADLTSFSDSAEPNIRFLAMLAGPFYPILHIVNERATGKSLSSITDSEGSKNCQLSSALTVSSNFEPQRSRMSPFVFSTSSSIAFRPDSIFVLLRRAYKDFDLGTVCRMASRILRKFIEPVTVQEASTSPNAATPDEDETSKPELSHSFPVVDYSDLFGEEFRIPVDPWDSSYLNILDLGEVEEGILHVLYACASQPLLCSKLAEGTSDFWFALPLVQALLPALRPTVSSPFDVVDESFSQWKQPIVQQALSQIVLTSASSLYRPLLHACAGYLSSFSPSHAKAACVLIDLCASAFAPWMAQVIAKIDLAVELLEDLLGIIQSARHSLTRARAALKYLLLALSGHMDDILGKYKEAKHRILFLVEMLEPFLDPAITTMKSTLPFGDLSSTFPEKQEHACVIAINVIRTAVRKPAVLPSLESEWRRGSVAPSVLLSILEPHMQLPPEVDLREYPMSKPLEPDSSNILHLSSVSCEGGASSKLNSQDDYDGRADISDAAMKTDVSEDVRLFFAPPELQSIALTNFTGGQDENGPVANHEEAIPDPIQGTEENVTHRIHTDLALDAGFTAEYFNLQADYLQLINYRDCELRASEFRRLALDLHSESEITDEGHDAAIDALLLAAECYVNPYFMSSFKGSSKFTDQMNISKARIPQNHDILELRMVSEQSKTNLKQIAHLEKKRDKIVLQILIEAAELDRKYQERMSVEGQHSSYTEGFDEKVIQLSPLNIQLADAITLVRQNQALLCNFLIQRLRREQHSMHEILMQSLVFLLHSATKLYCAPEYVIDIVLGSAEYLNGMLTSLYCQFKDGNLQLEPEKIHGIQRRWILLQRLVTASSSGDEGAGFAININNGIRYGNLVPPSAWMQRISTFSRSAFPLVRFLGWMAVSRNAKQYMKDRLYLASDLSHLTHLLSIYADDLALVDNVVNRKYEYVKIEESGDKKFSSDRKGFANDRYEDQSFRVIYPDLSKFFPSMKKQFEAFGGIILEAVGLQLRSFSSNMVPDVLCWFSELCSWPFSHGDKIASENGSSKWKGYVAKNAKAVILYILEAIITEHMEAMAPEIPRVVQVLVSLCGTAYCDVSFLDSVLCLLKPIVSYSLHKMSDEERLLPDDSCLNFESLCFDELLENIRQKKENQNSSAEKVSSQALTIFILASVFCDLSIQCKREILQSLIFWADFTAFEPTTSFHDYLSAFQRVIESCKALLVQTLRMFGAIPLQLPPFSDAMSVPLPVTSLGSHAWFLSDVCHSSCLNEVSEKLGNESSNAAIVNEKVYQLSIEEIAEFSKDLEALISKLNPTAELCWNLHPQLSRKLTISLAECFVYSRCLSLIAQQVHNAAEDDSKSHLPFNSADQFSDHWKTALEGLAELIMILQANSCWEVASVILDCLLGAPHCFSLDNVIASICSAIKSISCSAPKISWRLQTDKWCSILLGRGINTLHESVDHLVDLFCSMLGHPEPEQRFVALHHLGKLVGTDVNEGTAIQYSMFCKNLVSPGLVISVPESILSHLVSSTWNWVAVLASSDTSLPLRNCALAVLIDYIPFAERHQLQSFLAAADSVYGLGKLAHPTCEGSLLQLSLALISAACLYSPAEDISLIPQNVWRNIEAWSQTDSKLGDLEKKACQVLCRLRNEGDEAKEVLNEVLSSSSSRQSDPDFGSTRESILQVLANLTSVQSYFDIFSRKIDEEVLELEEAEMELDILQKEHSLQEDSKDVPQIPCQASPMKDVTRLRQIKDCIHSLEKSVLREDIVARRQKKIIMGRARQKYLEESALREAELLQEFDRERAAELEKEIERQRSLELERAKTKELRHNLDMEKERQTQRELQRELELAESGLRTSRRDFSSTGHSSRPRERYRERENGRSGNEGSTRSSGSLQPETSTSSTSVMPTVVLRQFSGQLPTILQSRDRPDESVSSYEENVDGSKDSGDTCSVGDPELVSAFDGPSGGFGSAQRHGSRGSKSRQVVERREREGRREGKWERKHS